MSIRLATADDHALIGRVFARASLSNEGDRENLLAHPELQGVLVEAPSVVHLARRRFERAGLLGRVRLEPADVFARVPEGLPAHLVAFVLPDSR